MARSLVEFDASLGSRCAILEQSARDQSSKMDDVSAHVARLAESVKTLEDRVGMAEKVECPNIRSNPDSPEFDRDPDQCIVRLNAAEMVSKESMVVALETLVHEANLKMEHFEIHGEPVSKRFVMRFTGTGGIAAQRARKLLSSLRTINGTWKRFQCKAPSGNDTNLYVGPDKNQKTIKTEVAGKQLVNVFKELYASKYPKLLKREGIVSAGYVSFARVTVAEDEDPKVDFDHVACKANDIDTDLVRARFSSASVRVGPVWG
jgi:hypothetical protein